MNQIKINEIDNFTRGLREAEPNRIIMNQDLKLMAIYLIKVGSNFGSTKRHNIRRHRELKLEKERIERIYNKYEKVLESNCDFAPCYKRRDCLHPIAIRNIELFIEAAAQHSPGQYEERRFFWCANNYEFYKKYSRNVISSRNQPISQSYSKLLSDIYFLLLNEEDVKSRAICALHLSVKHSEGSIRGNIYDRNLSFMIGYDSLEKNFKESLRKRFHVEEAENELKPVDVPSFIYFWNLTGLRRNFEAYNIAHESMTSLNNNSIATNNSYD